MAASDQLLSEGIFSNPDPLGLEPIPEDTRERFLRFRTCGGEVTLLPLQDVAAVLQLTTTELLPIPDVSSWLLGVCNWRGEMLWLVDVNSLLGNMPLWRQMPMLENTMIIVVQSGDRSVGHVAQQTIHIHQPQHFATPVAHTQQPRRHIRNRQQFRRRQL
ncbi:MAG: CheW domain-containing protein [Cyanobacteria bacterium J06642_11]